MAAGRVFLSYSCISLGHSQKVLGLANRLRTDGIDAWLDRYSPPPPEGWQLWMERQILGADTILVVCEESYQRRFDRQEAAGQGLGVGLEGRLIRQRLLEKECHDRVIPVLFTESDSAHIPVAIRQGSRYRLMDEYDALRRHLAGAPQVTPPPLGEPAEPPPVLAALPVLPVQSVGVPEHDGPADRPEPVGGAVEVKRVLIVAASPHQAVKLALGREVREVQRALRYSTAIRYEVGVLWGATNVDLQEGLLAMRPSILHFCCHGTATGVVLENDPSNEMTDESLLLWLKEALEEQDPPLDLMLINSCYSNGILDVFERSGSVVIGPAGAIMDDTAVAFSTAFYNGLAAGYGPGFAYHLGCSAADAVDPCAVYGMRSRIALTTGNERLVERGPGHTIAYLASESASRVRLRLDLEFRGISQALQRAITAKEIRLVQSWATRVTDFLQLLSEDRPSIVHLSGHGEPGGRFVFETDHGAECVAPCEMLVTVFSLFHGEIRCAVLLFEHSCDLAARLDDVLDVVICLKAQVADYDCLSFSAAFYRMVVAGRSFGSAFRAAIRATKDPEGFAIGGRTINPLTARPTS